MTVKKLIFMTAGETTDRNNLFESQVRKPAVFYQKSGFDVSIVSVEPLLKIIKNRILGIKLSPDSSKVRHLKVASLLQTRKMFSYLLIGFLSGRAARRVMRADVICGGSVIICRSYIAASIALKIKKRMGGGVIVVFDTRSILSNEIPLTNGFRGELIYGFLKKWEFGLIKGSDATLVTTKRGVDYFRLDTGLSDTIHHVPISGFDVKRNYSPDFKARWKNRKIAFIGSLAFWHSEDAIRNVLLEVSSRIGASSMIITGSPDRHWGIPQFSVSHSEIIKEYEKLIAIIVPGTERIDSYFRAQKNSINIFSTKAAEAFSIGLPVIANESITDLCDFIMENDCGVIYGYEDGNLRFVNCREYELSSEKFWMKKMRNAVKAGVVFRQESIVKRQLEIIRKLGR